jgi:hypothetical protein
MSEEITPAAAAPTITRKPVATNLGVITDLPPPFRSMTKGFSPTHVLKYQTDNLTSQAEDSGDDGQDEVWLQKRRLEFTQCKLFTKSIKHATKPYWKNDFFARM